MMGGGGGGWGSLNSQTSKSFIHSLNYSYPMKKTCCLGYTISFVCTKVINNNNNNNNNNN